MTSDAPQLQSQIEQGFGVIPGALPPQALPWACAAVDKVLAIKASTQSGLDGSSGQPPSGFTHVINEMGTVALYLMGSPVVGATARALCGPTAVPSHDWMVVKHPGIREQIDWHQDFVHDRSYPAITIGIHLDDSRADAVCVIPETHRKKQDMCALKDNYTYTSVGVTPLNAPAGSLAWHDVMMVHGSPERPAGHSARRTYYVEFRPLEFLLERWGDTSGYPEFRRQLWAIAERVHHRLGHQPTGEGFDLLESAEIELINQATTFFPQMEHAHYCMPGL